MLQRIQSDSDQPVLISAFQYHGGRSTETPELPVGSIHDYLSPEAISWINIDGVHQGDLIQELGRQLHIHPLTLEDILDPEQRPKLEEFDEYQLVVINMMYLDEKKESILLEQVSFVLGENYVISFQEHPFDVFEDIRQRIRNPQSRLHRHRADYLLYLLMDAVIDHYFAVLGKLDERIDDLEEEMEEGLTSEDLRTIQDQKRQLIHLRKSIHPMREVLNQLMHPDRKFIVSKTQRYFRDLQEQIHQISETIESNREILKNLQDLHISLESQKMNEVMKVLTIIATLFIPLTFIAGIYGMNFDHMPELQWQYGYYTIWGIMLVMASGMLYYFRKKRWL
jgi:magnesium transporter